MINIPKSLTEEERNLYQAAYKRCNTLINIEKYVIKDAVEEVIRKYEKIVTDTNELRDFLFREVTAITETGVTIFSDETRMDLSRKVQSTNSKYFKLSSYNIC